MWLVYQGPLNRRTNQSASRRRNLPLNHAARARHPDRAHLFCANHRAIRQLPAHVVVVLDVLF